MFHYLKHKHTVASRHEDEGAGYGQPKNKPMTEVSVAEALVCFTLYDMKSKYWMEFVDMVTYHLAKDMLSIQVFKKEGIKQRNTPPPFFFNFQF